jgi:hypothetical protein
MTRLVRPMIPDSYQRSFSRAPSRKEQRILDISSEVSGCGCMIQVSSSASSDKQDALVARTYSISRK